MNVSSNTIGQTLRNFRRDREISQEKLALMSDLDRTYISLLERGLRQPSLKTILQLSKSLDISAAKLVSVVEEMLNENPEN
ncbi:helix-turn-helix transcriptional regulator [Desulfobacterales bacterium HSG16]|nr:helix-turn-helix transcriptional regulator [Desulfobacterales bacterium HSG16]